MGTMGPISDKIIEDGKKKSTVKAICMLCITPLKEEDSLYPWEDNRSSAALCDECFLITCLIKIIVFRKKQRSEGNPDCFAKATNGYCDQELCKYHTLCVNLSLFIVEHKIQISDDQPVINTMSPHVKAIAQAALHPPAPP